MEPNSFIILKSIDIDSEVNKIFIATEPNDCEIYVNEEVTNEEKHTNILPSTKIIIKMKNISDQVININSFYVLMHKI